MNCITNLNLNSITIPSFLFFDGNHTSLLTTRRSRRRRRINPLTHFHTLDSITHLQGHVWNVKHRPSKLRPILTPYAGFLELPLLPFLLDQVLVPSESKKLHLYEARYLKLLDQSLFRKKNLFVHFGLDPLLGSSTLAEASFAARYGCLVVIEKVEQLDVGALVFIRGIGRVTLVNFTQADPFLEGIVIPLHDNVPENVSEISSKVLKLKEALHGLNSLEIKLKASKEASLQTQTANSLAWAEKELYLDGEEAFIPSFAERVSFAALQHVSGSTESELVKLQKEKLKAMDIKDTLERLDNSLKFVKNTVSMVAAKLAIQSLEMH